MPSPVKEKGSDPAFTWSSLERASDERLLALVRGGVDVAVEAVVRRYHSTLVRHAMRFLDQKRAEHVVQEALVKGIIQLQDEGKRVHLRSWLFRIVHSQAVDTSRRRGTDEARDSNDSDASAEYRERVERLRNIIVGVNRPVAVARAQSVERSRDEIAHELAEARAHVAVLIHRARASLRSAGGTLFPAQRIRTWVEGMVSPGMRGLVTAGAAALMVVTVAGAAMLSSGGGGLEPGSTSPSASSSSDSKPKVAGPRREGGTRTPAGTPRKSRRGTPRTTTRQSPPSAPVQVTPQVSGGDVTGAPTTGRPQQAPKPKKKKKPQSDSGGEKVIVLGEKKGTTGAGTTGTTGFQQVP